MNWEILNMFLSLAERREKTVLPLEQALKAAVYKSGNDFLLAQIAEKNCWSLNTLRSAINPTTPTHKANIYHFEAVLAETKDPRLMDSICATHGNAGWFELPQVKGLKDSDFMAQIGVLAREQGDLSQSVANAISDRVITKDEAAIIQKDVLSLVRATMNLYAMVEAYQEQGNE